MNSQKPKISNPNCEVCPVCENETLPRIRKDSHATGRMCSECKSIVARNGKIEVANGIPVVATIHEIKEG